MRSLTILVFLILWHDYCSPNIWNLKCSKNRNTFWAQHSIPPQVENATLPHLKKHSKTTSVLKALYILFIYLIVFFLFYIGVPVCVFMFIHVWTHTQVTVHLWRSKENLMRVNSLLLCRFWGSNSGLQTTWRATSWAMLLTGFETRPFYTSM